MTRVSSHYPSSCGPDIFVVENHSSKRLRSIISFSPYKRLNIVNTRELILKELAVNKRQETKFSHLIVDFLILADP